MWLKFILLFIVAGFISLAPLQTTGLTHFAVPPPLPQPLRWVAVGLHYTSNPFSGLPRHLKSWAKPAFATIMHNR
jgi:hypothetical protein